MLHHDFSDGCLRDIRIRDRPVFRKPQRREEDNIYVAAHRGWCEKYPENTLEAFEAAIALGVDQLETDIRVTRDGELVLIHDATVDRTTDGSGKVQEMTLQEIKALDAGVKKGEAFIGCRIPTLIEFMEIVKDLPEMTIDFELAEICCPFFILSSIATHYFPSLSFIPASSYNEQANFQNVL